MDRSAPHSRAVATSDAEGVIRVLHVDDEPGFAETAAHMLERRDDRLDVEATTDAEAALERLAAAEYDCVISDFDMPGTDGLELLERVRETEPALPFVLYTGKGSEEIASEAISAGVTDYLQKAAGTDQYDVLANRVTNAVAAYRAERQGRRDRRAMAAAWDGIATFDESGTFTYVNDSYAETFDHAPADLLGRPWDVVYSADGASVVAEEILPAVRETGTWTGSNRLTRADGTEFVGEHTVASVDGGGLVCVLRDRSDRAELGRRLRHERERFRLLVEAVEEYAIFLLEPDGTVASWNAGAERIKGYDESEIVGEHVSTFYPEADREAGRPSTLLERAREAGQVRDEGERVRADGSTFVADVTITALYEDGDLRGFAKVTKDVTDRVEREARRQRAEATRQRLYEITTDPDRSVAQTVTDVLALVVDYLDVAHGHLVAIDPATDNHRVVAVSEDAEPVPAGTETPLSETYCRHTIEHDGLLTVYDAREQGWGDDPAFQRFELGCYLGATIDVDGDLFGTACFVGHEPRVPFREDEKAVVELAARWLTTIVERHGDHLDWPLAPD